MATQNVGTFSVAADGVDPNKVPKKTLYTGAKIPAIGLGTFGSDRFSGEDIAKAVVGAASVGYRHFDCASVYGNEHLIGPAFTEIMRGGVRRDDLGDSTGAKAFTSQPIVRGPLGH